METINHRNLVDKFGGQAIARQICQIFLEESPELVREYRELESGNLEDIAASAHRLKGSLGMLEQGLSRVAGSLERACLQGNRERARALYQRLDRGLDTLRRELEVFVAQTA